MKNTNPSRMAVCFSAVLAAAALLMPSNLPAAIFAKYDGVDGESRDRDHPKWIDVLSVEWGMDRPGSSAASRRRGDVVVRDFFLVVEYDKASPKLAEKCLKGAVIPKLEIELTANYGGTRATYLKYELKNVMITSFQVNASGNDEAGPPTVVVGSNFEEIKVTYTEFDDTGKPLGNVEYEWKVEEGEALARALEADPVEEP